MDREIQGSKDSTKTRLIRAGIAVAEIGSLALASCGSAKASETAEPTGSQRPAVTETVTQQPTYEVTVESVTGEKIPLATPESLGMTPTIEVQQTTVEMILRAEELVKLARGSDPILYREVDSKHFLSEGFVETEIVPNLVSVSELPSLNGEERLVNILIKKDLMALFADAKIDEVDILIRSSYRSFWEQQYALDKAMGNTSEVTRPGESQHQTGLAIDFSTSENGKIIGLGSGFESTKAGEWLSANAWEYGFVPPYINGHDGVNPAAEPHHYLYVGRKIAEDYHKLKELGWEGDIFDLQEMIGLAVKGE